MAWLLPPPPEPPFLEIHHYTGAVHCKLQRPAAPASCCLFQTVCYRIVLKIDEERLVDRSPMSFLAKAKTLAESVVREATGKQDYHFGDFTKKVLGLPTHSDEEKQAAASDWIVLRDVASGRTYYQNNRLGVTQWDPPCPLPMQPQQHQQHPLPPQWETLFDASGRPYYVNHATRLSTYERPVPISSGGCFSAVPPPQYATFSRSAGTAADPARQLIGAIKMNVPNVEHPKSQGMFGSQKVSSGWREMRDPNGRIYYHNTVTGEVSYVRPVVDAAGSSLDMTDEEKRAHIGELPSGFGRFKSPDSDTFFAFVEHALLD